MAVAVRGRRRRGNRTRVARCAADRPGRGHRRGWGRITVEGFACAAGEGREGGTGRDVASVWTEGVLGGVVVACAAARGPQARAAARDRDTRPDLKVLRTAVVSFTPNLPSLVWRPPAESRRQAQSRQGHLSPELDICLGLNVQVHRTNVQIRACLGVAPRHAYAQLVRLSRYLAHAGVSSRRQAEKLIAAARVEVDGEVVTDPARDVSERSEVRSTDLRSCRRPARPGC